MISLVTTRKRKGVDDAKSSSNEKSKVRLIEHEPQEYFVGTGDLVAKSKTQRRVRTLKDLRRQGVKILSMFRTRGTFQSSTIRMLLTILQALCSIPILL